LIILVEFREDDEVEAHARKHGFQGQEHQNQRSSGQKTDQSYGKENAS
jgi:hypothetical protein